jgi:hypothetical protein
VNGWLGLLPNEIDHPAGMINAPPNNGALSADAYDLWFDDVPDKRIPNARYVPESPAHPAYLYWQTPSGGMNYIAWFLLGEAAAGYLDGAVAMAKQTIAAGGAGLARDWIAAGFHSPYYAGRDGPPSIASDTYWISDALDFSPDMKPLAVVSGADASRLLESYAATLHNWHALPPGGVEGYKVSTPAGREVFTFVRASGDTPARVMPAEAGGVYDATPVLTSIMMRALGDASYANPVPSVQPARSSKVALLAAAVVAGAFLLALGGVQLVARRRGRRIASA